MRLESEPGNQEMSTADVNEARSVERNYLSPEIAHQRFRTLEAMGVRPGERVLDAGCGPGLLTRELGRLAGEGGRVLAVDRSAGMLAVARERCAGMAQVAFRQSPVESLEAIGETFDVIACTQVLLYIAEVAPVLAMMHRLLAPGGRIAVVETDWRSCVMNSDDQALTEVMVKAWDEAVPSPNLPARLAPMLRSAGFSAVRIEPVPILDTSLVPDGYSSDVVALFSRKAVEQGRVDASRAREWLMDLERKAGHGEYFFCVNRFLFSAAR